MHLVFVTSLVPVTEPRSGYDIANRVIVDALRLMGHHVSVIGFLQPGAAVADRDNTVLLGELEVTNAKVGAAQKLRWLASAFRHGEPVSVAKMHAASRGQLRQALASVGPFDGIVLNSVQLPGAFLDLFSSSPCLYVAHNVEAASAAQNASTAGSPSSRFLFSREARLLRDVETRLCALANHVFTLADADRAALGVPGPDRSGVLPLVTSIEPPAPPASRAPEFDVGLVGSWTWAANRAGLDWFLERIVPRLPSDFKIAVAGGLEDTPAGMSANVGFLGRVPDARDFVRSVRVVPLVSRVGTGVQLKSIETFELGIPAVATRSSVRGIAEPPANCRVADDDAGFAEALIDLVNRARSGENLDVDGRAFHESQLNGLTAALAIGIERLSHG
ncbi:glycosyltransferase [Pseudohoeflea suaedae]|uniref:Glycosyltransferase n=1 Tax=Pseudohoeflea suaedae TaxID=877384 RepID=A0A4R5PRA2_9HYPH|nr:glycosyltransferase family 4 protein [Pseudohoeflea suaedae]TDH39413.1 glycosyltransferase [Pseudohoeflea suaedae]